MKAFRVVVNGEACGDFGVANASNAAVIVNIGRGPNDQDFEYWLSVSGLTQPDESNVSRHYRWACPSIQEGSRIEIEIVDSESCVPPTKLYQSDDEIQKPAFTNEEMREMRYQSYLELKKEFVP